MIYLKKINKYIDMMHEVMSVAWSCELGLEYVCESQMRDWAFKVSVAQWCECDAVHHSACRWVYDKDKGRIHKMQEKGMI